MGFLDVAYDTFENSFLGGLSNGVSKFADPSYWYEQNRADNISAENRQFQEYMTDKSYDLAYKNWRKEFDIESKFNSAPNQVSLLRSAGINPAVQQAAMNGTINMPSAVGGNATAPVPVEGVSHSDSHFLNAAKGLNTSIVNEKTKDLINSEIKANLAKAKMDDVYASLNEFALSLEKEFGAKKYDAVIKNLVQDLEVKVQDIALKKEEAANYSADAMLKMLQGPLIQAKRQLTEKEYEKLCKDVETYAQRLEADIRLKNASANQANAEAKEASEKAKTESDSREVRLEIFGIQRDIMRVEKNVKNATAMQQALANLENQRWCNKKLVEEVRKLYKQNRYEDVKQILGIVNQATESYLDLAKAGYFQSESIMTIIQGLLSRSPNKAAQSLGNSMYSSPSSTYP